MKTYSEKEDLIITFQDKPVHEGNMSFDEAALWILHEKGYTYNQEEALVSPYDWFNDLETNPSRRPLELWTIVRVNEWETND